MAWSRITAASDPARCRAGQQTSARRQDNVGCFQIRSRAADLEAGDEQLQRYFEQPESGASSLRSAAEGQSGRGHTSARCSVAMSARSYGWVEPEMGSCRETQLFRAAQTAALDSTIRSRPHGLIRSQLGMWSTFRGNRMPVRGRGRLVLFMHRSLSARL